MKELKEQPINLQQLEAALHRINDFNRMIENPQVSIRAYINMRAHLQKVIRRSENTQF